MGVGVPFVFVSTSMKRPLEYSSSDEREAGK